MQSVHKHYFVLCEGVGDEIRGTQCGHQISHGSLFFVFALTILFWGERDGPEARKISWDLTKVYIV